MSDDQSETVPMGKRCDTYKILFETFLQGLQPSSCGGSSTCALRVHLPLTRPSLTRRGRLSPVPLCPRMKLPVGFLLAGDADVGVDLGRADVRMAEEFLDRAEVRAVIEEVGGETVAQHVGRHVA